jgi:hypothetical protein
MIRPAKAGDIPRMTELMERLHSESRYNDAPLAVPIVRSLFLNAVMKHGRQHDGCTWTLVDEVKGQVEGFFIGMLDRVYHVCEPLAAKDMFLYATPDATPNVAGLFIDSYIKWAVENPNVYEINLSWTDAVTDADRIGILYARKGFRLCGGIYVRGKE